MHEMYPQEIYKAGRSLECPRFPKPILTKEFSIETLC